MRLIHLTDPHLTSLHSTPWRSLRGKRISGYLSWRNKRQYRHLPDVLKRVTEAVLAEQPDRILLTGDLMHIGLESEAAEAAAWLRSIAPPERLLLVPGNHDIYAPDSAGWLAHYWQDYLPAGGFPCRQDLGDIRIVGLNSAVVTPLFSARGALDSGQLSRLPAALDRNRLNILLIHHPPLPGLTGWRKALREADELAVRFREAAPDLALYGHIHYNRSDDYKGVRLFCTASASGQRMASYRVFDISGAPGQWKVSMQLKTLRHDVDNGGKFRVDEQLDWEVRRGTVAA